MLACRACGVANPVRFLSLGEMPLANGFLREPTPDEPRYPLDVHACLVCGLVQLGPTVAPGTLFKDYVYTTGVSSTMREHFDGLAQQIVRRQKLNDSSFVVDIGSNDGTLLQAFQSRGCRVLGVEPAENIARLARERGIPTESIFFSEGAGHALRSRHGPADVVTATNVFAHVPDPAALARGVDALLSPGGIFVIEVPYLGDLLSKGAFDTIYHEHVSYFALAPLARLLAGSGFGVESVQHMSVHGGTLRVFARKGARPGASVTTLLADEAQGGLTTLSTYERFADGVTQARADLRALVGRWKKGGKRLAAYGAAAKGNVLLNYCGIGAESLDYIVDKSPLKQGLYAPGTHLRVEPPERLVTDRPDYVLLLVWNIADEVRREQAAYERQGGKFVVPIPSPTILA